MPSKVPPSKSKRAHPSVPAGKHTTTITQVAVIPATPVEVYDALVNARKHAAFTGVTATSVRRIGGRFTAWDGYISGRYLALIPGRKIAAEWTTTEWPADYPPSVIEFTFEPIKKGTRLKMIQSQVPTSQAPNYRTGWRDYYWNPLRAYFAAKAK
ncbi:MAG TPA: SRPBCC domain-containing protein [Candidatus Binataceae bacterium]|jgi:activator of HSP90 ATPase